MFDAAASDSVVVGVGAALCFSLLRCGETRKNHFKRPPYRLCQFSFLRLD